MKALFISEGIVGEKPGLSGGEVRFFEIASVWQKIGHTVELLSTAGAEHLVKHFNLNAKIHQINSGPSKSRTTFIINFLKSWILPKSLKDFNEGLVYSTNEQLYDVIPGLLLKLRNRRKIKWAVVVHWLPSYKWWKRSQSNFLNSLLFLISERLSLYIACFFADRILAVSESTKRQISQDILSRYFIKKVSAVSCGVNFEEIRSCVKDTKAYDAVYMKRLQSVKGVFDLIDIWKIVTNTIPGAKLAVIGSGIDGEKAKIYVKEKGLSDCIEFLGAIYENKLKIEKLSSSKLFLLPTYEENWSIVIGEAMAAGLPVICYNLPELKEVWSDIPIYVEKGNIKLFAENVIRLLQDSDKLENMKKDGLSFIKRYNWEDIALREFEEINR